MQYSRAGGYPTAGYSIPPRGTLQQQGYPAAAAALQQSRTMVPTTPGYIQRGGAGSAANYFNPNSAGGMTLPTMQQPSPNSSLPSLQQTSLGSLHHQQQQVSSLHLAANQATGTSSNSSDNVIDQSDFPPLGAATTTSSSNAGQQNTGGSSGFHSTYASQASNVTGGTNAVPVQQPQQRDFGHDDFPPLGANPSSQGSQSALDAAHSGTNGFSSQPQTASSLMMGGGQQLGQAGQTQRTMQGLTSEMEKRVCLSTLRSFFHMVSTVD